MQEKFQKIIQTHDAMLAIDTKTSNRLGYAKLAAVVALVVCIVLLLTSGFSAPVAVLTAAVFALTVYLWVCHSRVDGKVKYSTAICQICRNHIARITGEWADFPDTGQEFADSAHPYACDLDIVGAKSLVQFLNTTHTWHGRQAFAGDLLQPQYNSQEIAERQTAIKELAGDIEFANDMQFFLSQIGASKQDAQLMEEISDGTPLKLRIASRFRGKVTAVIKFCILFMPVVSLPLLLAGWLFELHPALVTGIILVICQCLLRLADSKTASKYLGVMHRIPYKLGKYAKVMHVLAAKQFASPALAAISAQTQEGKHAMQELESIGNKLSVVANPLVYIALNVFLLWDFHCAFLLERWKKKYATNAPAWFSAIGEFESLLAFSHLPNVCEGTTLPAIAGTGKTLTATALGHPLLPNGKRVCNNLQLANNIFIISGSNMSGKTTFMRTVGINLVLARAGSYVCASSLVCSVFDIVTSMRISDDLNQGVSTFYAELMRIKYVIDTAKVNSATLFFIDEIFKGTNSVDRLAGADAVISNLERLGAVGMVSTHDLDLCRLADMHSRILNFSFCENYAAGKINFDYIMRPGQSTTTNAKFLMEMVGIS